MRKRLKEAKIAGLFLILVCSIFAGSSIFAEKGPKIKFQKEVWDFGRVKQGEVLTCVFVFKNEGDETLQIRNVRTSCGCAAALASDQEIPPGRTGEIKTTFDTRGYAGRVSKLVFVESNDPSQPTKQLTLSADIETPPSPRINLGSYSLDLGLVLEREEIQGKVKIENTGERELEVFFNHKNASFFSRGKKVTSPLRIASGKAEEVEIRIPSPSKTGAVREYVVIRSNDPLRPSLSLPLAAYIVTKDQLKELFARYKDILK